MFTQNDKLFLCVCDKESKMYGLFCEFDEDLYKTIMTTIDNIIDKDIGIGEEKINYLNKLYNQGLLNERLDELMNSINETISDIYSKYSFK